MRDLELRGAGNLLGDEQSGHVAALGFELYLQMLDEAVRERAGRGGRRRRRLGAGAPRRQRRRLRARPTTSPTSRRRSTCTAGSRPPTRSPSSRSCGPSWRTVSGPIPPPLQNLISLQRARIKLGQAGARAVTFRGNRLAVTPVELDSHPRQEAPAGDPRGVVRVGEVAGFGSCSRRSGAAFPRGRPRRGRPSGGDSGSRLSTVLRTTRFAEQGHDRHRHPPPPHARTGFAALLAAALSALALSRVRRGQRARQRRRQGRRRDDHRRPPSTTGCRSPRSRPRVRRRRRAARGQDPAVRPTSRTASPRRRRRAPKPPKGQPQADRRPVQGPVQAGVRGPARPGHAAADPGEVGPRRGREQDVKVTDAEVKKAFEEQKKQSFPKKGDYEKFLKTSGFTEEDILFRVRLEQLSNKLREKIVKGKDKVSDEQIEDYYNKNKKRFAQPERRDLRIVLTKTEAKANEAKAALEDGDSWKEVAKKYSIDQASKNQGGSLLAVAKGQQEPALDEAVFEAKKGELAGPVKTQFGQYVFQVQKITPASQQTLEQAKATIRGILASENQQKALDSVHQGLPGGVEGEDELPLRLRDAGLQERAEAEEHLDRAAGGRARSRAGPQTPTPQQAPPGAAPPAQQAPPAAGPPQQAPPQQAPPQEQAVAREEITEALGRLDDVTRQPARRVPVGPRAGRAHDRPAHGRGGLRAGRRRQPRRRRQAARRAGRRPLPGPLPLAAAWRSGGRGPGRGRRALPPEAHPPPPARLRETSRRRPPARCSPTGTRSRRPSPGREQGIFGEVPENLPGAALRAQGDPPRAARPSVEPPRGRPARRSPTRASGLRLGRRPALRRGRAARGG